ncbi:MAG: ABC transporter permease [Lachnospiraceae bacterium]|nr:ABC transporter permease [Lachnospiraceae bacterium]
MRFMCHLSLLNMKRRGTRTILTVLGVAIGVISVVTLLALGFGVKKEMLKDFGDASSVKRITVTGSQNYKEKNKLLTERNIEKFKSIDYVANVYPEYVVDVTLETGKYSGWISLVGIPKEELSKLTLTEDSTPVKALNGNQRKPEIIMGNSMGYLFYNWKTNQSYKEGEGRPFRELVHTKMKAQIGYDDNLITDKLSIEGFLAGDEDQFTAYSQCAYCDLDVLKKYLRRNSINGYIMNQPTDAQGKPISDFVYTNAVVVVDELDNVEFVVKRLQDMGFQTENEKEYLDSAKRSVNVIQLLLGGIGTIALVVALIGIGNTMTTSVYDRVNEIGVLKVIGCDLDELVGMFLVESGILGFIGGVLGVIASFAIKGVLNSIAVMAFHFKAGTQLAIIPWWLVIGAVMMSTVLGVLAGYFPARWASKLNPLEAVRK